MVKLHPWPFFVQVRYSKSCVCLVCWFANSTKNVCFYRYIDISSLVLKIMHANHTHLLMLPRTKVLRHTCLQCLCSSQPHTASENSKQAKFLFSNVTHKFRNKLNFWTKTWNSCRLTFKPELITVESLKDRITQCPWKSQFEFFCQVKERINYRPWT